MRGADNGPVHNLCKAWSLAMSIEAMTYVKTVDLGKAELARLTLMIIAENTYNDSGLCRIGKAELAFQVRRSAATVKRHCRLLVKHKHIRVLIKPGNGGGREKDEISIVGFLEWVARLRDATNPRSSRSSSGKPPSARGQSVILTDRATGQESRVNGGGNRSLVTDYKKDSRTRLRTSAREGAKDSKSGLSEGKGSVVRAALAQRLGHAVYEAWFAKVEFGAFDGRVLRLEAPEAFIARWIASHFLDDVRACAGQEFPGVEVVSIAARPA
jgi:hypothetical protein